MKRAQYPKPKKESRSKLEARLWELISLYVRARDGFHCRIHKRCSELAIPYPCVCSGHLEACHLYSDKPKYSAIKYDLRNIVAGCSAINKWAFHNQTEWEKLWKILWKEDAKYLDVAKGMKTKRTRQDIQWMILDFQERLKDVLTERQYTLLINCGFNYKKWRRTGSFLLSDLYGNSVKDGVGCKRLRLVRRRCTLQGEFIGRHFLPRLKSGVSVPRFL